jgi:dihydrofolate reductase
LLIERFHFRKDATLVVFFAPQKHHGGDISKMRNVVLAIQLSLDGFIEGPSGELDWAMQEDEETWKYVFDLQSADTLLLGRIMYPGFEKYWLAAPTNPSSTKNEIEYLALQNAKNCFFKNPEKGRIEDYQDH